MADESTGASIGHVVNRYLPRSATFIHTLLRHHLRYRPVVLAAETMHLDEFPVPTLEQIGGRPHTRLRRLSARFADTARGVPGRYDRSLARAARRQGCALLHAHFGPAGARSLDARVHLGIPLITTFYGFDLAFGRDDPRWREAYRRLFDEGRLFVCEGPAMAEQLVAVGAPRERVRIVPIGIDLEQFPFEPRRREGPLVLIQTGRFVEKKGADLSVRAFASAREVLADAELWLIGDGPERERLERLTAELDLDGSVRFLGMVSHAQYRDAMRCAHIGLQPSRTAADGDTEGGAPTVLLEMQAAGMPVVGTRHADIPFVVAAPEELVEEEDAEGLAEVIVRVAQLPDAAWRQRIEAGRTLVASRHCAPVTAAQTERLYDEALGTS